MSNSLATANSEPTSTPTPNRREKNSAEGNAHMGTLIDSTFFLPTFLPTPESARRGKTSSKPHVMPQRIVDMILKATSERQIAEAWAAWLTPTSKNAKGPCPGYRLGLSQDRWDKGDTNKLKVDGALYLQEEFVDDGLPHWEAMRALLEFKKTADGSVDSYNDKTKGDGASETRTDVRGQITSYVAHAFSHQHRTSVLLFLVTGRKMRVTRWDRSGTIFTESFNYIEHRDRLRDILWGFSLLGRDKQGLDDTATPLDKDDVDYVKMDVLATPCDKDISEAEGTIVDDELEPPYTFKFVRAAFRESLDGHATRYRLTVPVKDGPHRTFLVGKPVFVAPGMSGRGTRGFVAWDNTANHFVFLKDAWRPYYENVDTEGKVLRALRDAGVKNIPTYVCDGEIEQVTVTREHSANASSNKPPAKTGGTKRKTRASARASVHDEDALQDPELIPPCQMISPNDFVNRGKNLIRSFRHYRVVVEEVCLALHKFKTGKQLMTVVRDCVEAHAGAVNDAKILHRDVSAGNMLICPTVERDNKDGKLRVVWRGILSDWELSKSLVSAGQSDQARQPVRTGTWQFASAYILDNPDEPVRIADEIESFFHVSLYNALRYLRHNCPHLQIAMFDYFDQFGLEEQRYCCGDTKRNAMRFALMRTSGGRPYHFFDDSGSSGHPINSIFGVMLNWFKARYIKVRPGGADSAIEQYVDDDDIAVPGPSRRYDKMLENHDAFLSLLDEKLKLDWPVNDKAGDQLAKAKASSGSQSVAQSRSGPVPAPNFEGGSGSEDGDDGEVRRPSPKRAKTKDPTVDEDPIDDFPRPPPGLARLRGNRTRRGTSSRTPAPYNLRRNKSRTK
ncbi:hypothetical protein C8Q74DRAFT_1442726 [Fomes fomentarius]|nr:hypothetical protein C8Q74DRAFT_1442726 [Fomes fomentarius]